MASGKIMIVDDDRNICELLRLYIEKEGFETAIANRRFCLISLYVKSCYVVGTLQNAGFALFHCM